MENGIYEFTAVRAIPLRVQASSERQARERAERFCDWLTQAAAVFSAMDEEVVLPGPPSGVQATARKG